jgi:thiosulfate/3-mercaptopyruvate sulfurtransferase
MLAGSSARQTIVHCGSGVTACHTLLALDRAGLSGAKLYVGSWSEWCRNPARAREPDTRGSAG